jgi:hypothetical protein
MQSCNNYWDITHVKKKTLDTLREIYKFVVHFFRRLLKAQFSDMSSHACEY